jgi:ABC-type lipoprotein export system ATPase subunit
MNILRRLNQEQGLTVVLVTHEADIAAYAQRVLVMRDGLLVDDRRSKLPRAEAPGLYSSATDNAVPASE